MCVRAGSMTRSSLPDIGESSRAATFLMMLRAFAPSGGVTNDPCALARSRGLADSIATIDTHEPAIFVEWDGLLWFPTFQFEPQTLSLRPVVKTVIAELKSVFDMWELAAWFCEPNLWLGDRRPVDMVDGCPDCVLGAARADRFIALG
jgi:hypothetical protein